MFLSWFRISLSGCFMLRLSTILLLFELFLVHRGLSPQSINARSLASSAWMRRSLDRSCRNVSQHRRVLGGPGEQTKRESFRRKPLKPWENMRKCWGGGVASWLSELFRALGSFI